MNANPIIHEWFYPGGPDTLEYPLASQARGDEIQFPAWLEQFTSLTEARQVERLHQLIDESSSPELLPLASLVKELIPWSIVVHENDYWLLCKKRAYLEEPSGHGNMLMIAPSRGAITWPSELEPADFKALRQFLTLFGGVRIDMPPSCGVVAIQNLRPAVENEETYAWRNIRQWAGSYSVFDPGNGDSVLAGLDGRFGLWSHEMCESEGGAVSEIGGFPEFLQYVVSQSGLDN